MPTYAFKCPRCGVINEVVMSISSYIHNPPQLHCCDALMRRHFDVVPALALHNALANDRIYQDLRAPDGADISTRAKHREYMKRNNLTTVDDFTHTWERDARERKDRIDGVDPTRKQDIARAIDKLGG